MAHDIVTIDTDDRGVATLWLDRAEKHNALNAQMIRELHEAATALSRDDAVRVVVLAAKGRTFCAGGDLGWMREQFDATPEQRGREAGALAWMLKAINLIPKPVIGRIHGNAFGGGVGMASVCDVTVGTTEVTMALTETRLGLIPATIGPYVAARMGEARARRVFMSGRAFKGAEAVDLGLLSRAVAPDALDEAVEAEVAPYLQTAPGAVARAKALLRHLGPPITDEIIEHSIGELVACWEGTEAPEGIGAFFAKEKPSWQS
ncbi:enoyl-CoA hydratase [Pseudooceanicola batsensis HTCC2597]|uniref:Enoyl-CoA hydratase n=1 Tax=Pseudooceanicola batsensis (strain ATCC BAA-863 / DSM 15984 / KCTC 12145 / HTCC2597) TaxID=252305 RepID=A3U1L5_PSEBH|nr:crotonase/enoyl-CoA hydratase family protein [Pseudooceanicola batsensis]EAQ01796.1 enoyl-CoA hydratase [Pseudooceanicola batsensis HTCC2597]